MIGLSAERSASFSVHRLDRCAEGEDDEVEVTGKMWRTWIDAAD